MKVLAFGTFDKVHPGHEYYLKKAKKYGELTVVIARDLNVKKIKGKFPTHMEMRRLEDIKKLGIADNVILGNISDPYQVIEDEKPDYIALGYDQEHKYTKNLRRELRNRKLLVEIIRIPALKPELFKSSKIK